MAHEVLETHKQLTYLESKVGPIKQLLDIHDAVFAGLDHDELQLHDSFFVKKKTFDLLSSEMSISRGTLQTRKRDLVEKVDFLVETVDVQRIVEKMMNSECS